MASSSARQRHPKRPHCFICDSVLSASWSFSAASTRQRQRRRRSRIIDESTATSVHSSTLTVSSFTMASAVSSSTSSRSACLPLHSTSSIRQQWQQRRSATIFVPTPLPPSSSMATPLSVPSTPSTLPSSTLTCAGAESSMSSLLSIPALASGPSLPYSLAPSDPSNISVVDVPSEPSFRDPALAERYWKYDHQKLSLSNAIAAELAFTAWLTVITRKDLEEEKNVCAICMEEYRDLQPCYILLRCFHFFHAYCLLEWGIHCFLQGKEMNCPLCRSHCMQHNGDA